VKKLYVFLSHFLTEEQKKDAIKTLGVTKFVSLPSPLQKKWGNIESDRSLKEKLKPFFDYILDNVTRDDYLLIQGEAGISFALVDWCLTNGYQPIYSYTKRVVIEKEIEKNKVEKKSVFKHIKFIFYERFL